MPFIEFDCEVRALGPGVLTVGSGPEAGWRIAGRGLDPVHMLLSAQPGGRALLIRGSPSSTVLVNGAELVPLRTLLSFGDRVAVGTVELRYRRLAPGSESPTGYLRDVRRGRLYQLRERSTIGRDMASTVVIHEPDVSRMHAELIQKGEAYLIVPHAASVTSVNGARLLAPTVLQEGDEITVGRTALRFTTALPSSTAISRDPPAHSAAGLAKESKAQTTFIGTIEAQEHRSRVTRRRMTRAASIALIAIAAAAVIVTLYADAHPTGASASRAHGRSARRAVRASSASASRGGAAKPGGLLSIQAPP
jgi:predicted component of type VI protein secretion system